MIEFPTCLGLRRVQYLFDTVKPVSVMKCGHTIHEFCLRQLQERHIYACPICSKSIFDMSSEWASLDETVKNTPMPEEYDVECNILCNDCVTTSTTKYHFYGCKCLQCGSYNTRKV